MFSNSNLKSYAYNLSTSLYEGGTISFISFKQCFDFEVMNQSQVIVNASAYGSSIGVAFCREHSLVLRKLCFQRACLVVNSRL